MRKLSFIALISLMMLYACSGNNNRIDTIDISSTEIGIPTEPGSAEFNRTDAATETAVPRKVVIVDIDGPVLARGSSGEELSPASIGTNISNGGSIDVGADGRVRLDLLPEGTIVRAVNDTAFTLAEIGAQPSQTAIELAHGKLFLLLNGGTLKVITPVGVASVSDGLLRVMYDPQRDLFRASCLHGSCELKNISNEKVTLSPGEFSFIESTQQPVAPRGIYREEIYEWLDEITELAYFLPDLPDLKDYPLEYPNAPTPTRRPPSRPTNTPTVWYP